MTGKEQIYRCDVCDNLIKVLHQGEGKLVCCDVPMVQLTGKNEGMGKEKHVPVIEKSDKSVIVKVGEIPHPMEEDHFIEWIELAADGKIFLKYLEPGFKPEVEFLLDTEQVNEIFVREYCSIHGLWKS